MFLINANVLDDKFCLRKADIEIEDGKIVRLEDSLPYKEEDLVVDCAGYTIVPGGCRFQRRRRRGSAQYGEVPADEGCHVLLPDHDDRFRCGDLESARDDSLLHG